MVVLGPTGTGKELVARALHACSPRAAVPFISVHCAGLPAELLESELFGHLKGSFSGAHRDLPGVLEGAHRATLFLEEVGEVPQAMQVKLLRFLQEGTFLPVGPDAEARRRARGRRHSALPRRRDRAAGRGPCVPASLRPGSLGFAVADLETRMLREMLAATEANQSEAARRLGISRVGLIKKMTCLGLR